MAEMYHTVFQATLYVWMHVHCKCVNGVMYNVVLPYTR